MILVALIHTEGVILFHKYVILELAYADILGQKKHFFIQSPISYQQAIKTHRSLHKSLEVIMCQSRRYKGHKVYRFYEIIHFLKSRYYTFYQRFGRCVIFGYKGKSFQQDILRRCSIPSFNVENIGVPNISTLARLYSHLYLPHCLFHKSPFNKCAEYILRLILHYITTSQTQH